MSDIVDDSSSLVSPRTKDVTPHVYTEQVPNKVVLYVTDDESLNNYVSRP